MPGFTCELALVASGLNAWVERRRDQILPFSPALNNIASTHCWLDRRFGPTKWSTPAKVHHQLAWLHGFVALDLIADAVTGRAAAPPG